MLNLSRATKDWLKYVELKNQMLSPQEIIEEELRIRWERKELTEDKSPSLIKLTKLYWFTFKRESKPQMFPSDQDNSYDNM